MDFKILLHLKENAKQSLSVLEEKLDKRSSTIHSRIKKLEAKDIIRNYSINVNYKELGFPLVAFIMLSFDKHETNYEQETVAKQIAELAAVQEIHLIAGEFDMIVKVRAKDIDELGRFVTHEIKQFDGVSSSRTFISLNNVKEMNEPPFILQNMID